MANGIKNVYTKLERRQPFVALNNDWSIDFNVISTSLSLCYAKRLGNRVYCTFIITYFVLWLLKSIFWTHFYRMRIFFNFKFDLEIWAFVEMDTATWVRILNEAVRISHRAKTLDKNMNPTILFLVMGKTGGLTGLFKLVMATGLGKGEIWIQTSPCFLFCIQCLMAFSFEFPSANQISLSIRCWHVSIFKPGVLNYFTSGKLGFHWTS